jgi:hypothetical protein
VNAGKLQQLPQEGHPFIRHDITRLVMTFTETSAGYKDAIRPCLQGLQDIMRRYRPGTHHPDDPDRSRILHSTDPSQVSRSISSPGAKESNDLRLKIIRHQKLHSPLPSLPLKGGRARVGVSFCNDFRRPWPFQFEHRSACW